MSKRQFSTRNSGLASFFPMIVLMTILQESREEKAKVAAEQQDSKKDEKENKADKEVEKPKENSLFLKPDPCNCDTQARSCIGSS